MSSRPPTAIPCDPTPPSFQTHPDFQQEFHEDGTITMADGKIRKRMVKKANINAECPPPQAEVTVHYIGTFDDGRTFDNSRVRNAPFTFRLGGQAVIRGWEIAIRSMKLGEVAKFWIASELAYGSEGRLPEVPPNTPLNFEIELINWTMRQKVTEDGGVYKTIINAGTGPNRPNDFAVTKIRYQGKNKDGKVFDDEHWSIPLTYIVSSHASPPPGFDDAIKNMYAGEHSIFTLRPDYGWGEKGCAEKNLGPNEQVIYEIVLEEFTKGRESWEMSLEEKVERMLILKDQGNSYFKQGDLGRAFAHYEKSVKWIQYDAHLTPEEKSRVDAIKVINYQNMAIVRSKEKKWDEVIKYCSEGLKLDAKHVKCLFLRGKAYTALHDSERALADLKIAAELAPDSAEIKAAQRGVEADITRTRRKEQSMWGGLFSRHHVKLIDDTEPDVQHANKLKEREKEKQEIEKKKKEDDNWDSDEEDLEAADETPEQARKREEEAIAIAREEAAADAMQQKS